jgi:hypothetical protein
MKLVGTEGENIWGTRVGDSWWEMRKSVEWGSGMERGRTREGAIDASVGSGGAGMGGDNL